MADTNNIIYIVDAHYETQTDDNAVVISHKIIGIYYDMNAAVNLAMNNVDIEQTKDKIGATEELTDSEVKERVKKKLENEGTVRVWWTPMRLGNILAKKIWADISEYVINS